MESPIPCPTSAHAAVRRPDRAIGYQSTRRPDLPLVGNPRSPAHEAANRANIEANASSYRIEDLRQRSAVEASRRDGVCRTVREDDPAAGTSTPASNCRWRGSARLSRRCTVGL